MEPELPFFYWSQANLVGAEAELAPGPRTSIAAQKSGGSTTLQKSNIFNKIIVQVLHFFAFRPFFTFWIRIHTGICI